MIAERPGVSARDAIDNSCHVIIEKVAISGLSHILALAGRALTMIEL
jgi:hypothetical protein